MKEATKFFEFDNDFSSKTDEEIVAIVKQGSKEALNFLLNKLNTIAYITSSISIYGNLSILGIPVKR